MLVLFIQGIFRLLLIFYICETIFRNSIMNKTLLTPRITVVISILIAGALLRIIPHWPNFTPVAAIALFGGTYLKRKDIAFLLPVAVMLISDAILGFHGVMIPVYASFLLIVGLGFILRRKVTALNLVSASLVSSLLFFLITNYASWATGLMPYSPGFPGLLQAYIAGLPFFLNGIMGDLFFNGLFFGAFYLITNRWQVFAR